jgi:hypothetical protein
MGGMIGTSHTISNNSVVEAKKQDDEEENKLIVKCEYHYFQHRCFLQVA